MQDIITGGSKSEKVVSPSASSIRSSRSSRAPSATPSRVSAFSEEVAPPSSVFKYKTASEVIRETEAKWGAQEKFKAPTPVMTTSKTEIASTAPAATTEDAKTEQGTTKPAESKDVEKEGHGTQKKPESERKSDAGEESVLEDVTGTEGEAQMTAAEIVADGPPEDLTVMYMA